MTRHSKKLENVIHKQEKKQSIEIELGITQIPELEGSINMFINLMENMDILYWP